MTEELSLAQKGINLSKYTWELMNHVAKHPDKLMVSDKVYEERILVCKSCDKFKEVKNECAECGCYIPAKAKVFLDSCPLNKWTEDRSDWEERFTDIQKAIDNSTKIE